MKKLALTIFSLLLAATGFAKEISQSEAVEVAQRMMKQKNVKVTEVSSVTPLNFNGQKSYYAVQFQPSGWALISADDVATPLIGYSAEGEFPVLNMPENMRGWLGLNALQISECSNLGGVRNSTWDRVEIVAMAASDKVSPLIKVQWNQGSPYNKYCPSNSSAGRAVVGCVAVAMAQAMTVPQHPSRPEGYISYNSGNPYGSQSLNYDNEPAYNWANIMSGANNKDDVARLLWHCGLATQMQYGPGGSGTQTSYVPGALKSYFGYPSSVTYLSRSSYKDLEWNSMLLGELKAGRPVIVRYSIRVIGIPFKLNGFQLIAHGTGPGAAGGERAAHHASLFLCASIDGSADGLTGAGGIFLGVVLVLRAGNHVIVQP